MLLFASSGPLMQIPQSILKLLPTFVAENFILNAGFFFGLLLYCSFYLYLGDYIVAIPYNIFLTILFLTANKVHRSCDSTTIALIFIVCQVVGWGMQVIVGHNKIEGRKAALFDSLFDAVFMAPLFTWYEVLFTLGFRADFRKRLQKRVEERIAEMDKGKTGQGSSGQETPVTNSSYERRKPSGSGSRKTE